MKVRLVMFLAIVSLLISVIPAASQINESKWTANIPFDFIVGDNHMPAGQYVIKSNPQTMRLILTNKETRQRAVLFTRNVQELARHGKTELIFRRDGDRHVLHQVWDANESHGHDVEHGEEVIELMQRK